MNYIYRHYHISKTTEKAAGALVRALLTTGGRIVSMGCLRNGYPVEKISYWESFYTLEFSTQEQIAHFHELGFVTKAPELVMGAEPWTDYDS
jgi:hypothetical protein